MTLFEDDPEADWWLNEQRKDPDWVAAVDADIERARMIREIRPWLNVEEHYEQS